MGTIEFIGTNNAIHSVKLIANQNIRDFDYSPPAFADTINSEYTREVFNNRSGQRLDLQTFKLPECFLGQKLTTIRITDNGGANIQRLFLYGVTVQAHIKKKHQKVLQQYLLITMEDYRHSSMLEIVILVGILYYVMFRLKYQHQAPTGGTRAMQTRQIQRFLVLM